MSTYEISKSSLLSLKAEILRKHEELTKAKTENEKKIKIIKKNAPLEFKKHNKDRKSTSTEVEDSGDDCHDLLKQSRLVLEEKAALYDRLRSGNVTEEEKQQHKGLLVRFDNKNKYYSDSDEEPDKYPESEDDNHHISSDDDNCEPSEKWVDYVDCLGRTRRCLQKDLDYLKAKDSDLKKIVDAKKKTTETEARNIENDQPEHLEEEKEDLHRNSDEKEAELLSSDMRREILREQWEKEEEEIRKKTDVHYQDILFGEARTHGVGYYGFSKSEDERLKQQDALSKLRQETEQKQKRAQELKMMREKQLAARIKAAKERRRARLGLPPEEEAEEAPVPMDTKPSEEDMHKQELQKQQEEKEQILNQARKRHLRPWDVGKDGITKDHYEMTQDEWSEMKRSERIDEFAPPSSYMKEKKKKVEIHKDLDGASRRTKNKKSSQQWKDEKEDSKSKNPEVLRMDDPVRTYRKRNAESPDRGQGTEIPPPMDFDYHQPSSSKASKRTFEKNDINDSIEAGLRFLRKKMEEKQSRKPK